MTFCTTRKCVPRFSSIFNSMHYFFVSPRGIWVRKQGCVIPAGWSVPGEVERHRRCPEALATSPRPRDTGAVRPCGRHGAAGRGVCPALAARPSAACARAQGVCPWGSGVQPCEGAGPLGRGSARGVFCASATRWGRRAKHREKVEPAGPRPPRPPHAPPLAPAGDLRAAGLRGKRCPSPVGQDRLNPLNPEPCRLPAAALRSLGEKTG